MTPLVAMQSRKSVAAVVSSEGLAARSTAAAPATCGHAIEVPEIVLVCVVEPGQAACVAQRDHEHARAVPQ